MQIGKTIKSTARYVPDVFDSKFLLCVESINIREIRETRIVIKDGQATGNSQRRVHSRDLVSE